MTYEGLQIRVQLAKTIKTRNIVYFVKSVIFIIATKLLEYLLLLDSWVDGFCKFLNFFLSILRVGNRSFDIIFGF